MGKKSIKEDKNRYQLAREARNLTREEAAELLEFISSARIEKIERGDTEPHPDEILAFAKCYKNPEITLNYCSKDCLIGQRYIPEIKPSELHQIVIELLAALNSMNRHKDRLIDITVDGIISEDEKPDFKEICDELDRISAISGELKLWLEKQIL